MVVRESLLSPVLGKEDGLQISEEGKKRYCCPLGKARKDGGVERPKSPVTKVITN